MSEVPVFNTNRMVSDYTERYYFEAFEQSEALAEDRSRRVREIVARKQSLQDQWHEVTVTEVQAVADGDVRVGATLPVEASVHLGALTPDDVVAELYAGRLNGDGIITRGRPVPMRYDRAEGGVHVFVGEVPCDMTGQQGFTVRLLPRPESAAQRFDSGLITWWKG